MNMRRRVLPDLTCLAAATSAALAALDRIA